MNQEFKIFDRAGPPAEGVAKRAYAVPRVVVYGGVAEITRQGGYTATDVPQGTPIGPGGVTSVAS